ASRRKFASEARSVGVVIMGGRSERRSDQNRCGDGRPSWRTEVCIPTDSPNPIARLLLTFPCPLSTRDVPKTLQCKVNSRKKCHRARGESLSSRGQPTA